MQSIAEQVVETSGGGGKYITSGFSSYVGHSAIGLAKIQRRASPSTPYAIVIGTIYSDARMYPGYAFVYYGSDNLMDVVHLVLDYDYKNYAVSNFIALIVS